MKIKVLKETPRNIKEFPVENEYNLSKEEVTDIAVIFMQSHVIKCMDLQD